MIATIPPMTHTNWKRVSNLANARPRTASGPSRCSRLSNPSRPAAAPIPSVNAASTKPTEPATSAPSNVKTAGSTSDDARIISSRTERRSAGATMTPPKLPAYAAPPARPNAMRSCLSEKAAKKARKPTLARSTAIALEPEQDARGVHLLAFELLDLLVDRLAHYVRGIWIARIVAITNTTAP